MLSIRFSLCVPNVMDVLEDAIVAGYDKRICGLTIIACVGHMARDIYHPSIVPFVYFFTVWISGIIV